MDGNVCSVHDVWNGPSFPVLQGNTGRFEELDCIAGPMRTIWPLFFLVYANRILWHTLAVSHGFGGPNSDEKAQWLVGVIENYFAENDDLEPWELEEFVSQIMSEEFNTVLDDGSLTQVAKEIFTIHGLWSQNKMSDLQAHLQTLPQVNLGECVSQGDEGESNKPDLGEIHEEEMTSLSIGPSASNETREKPAEDGDGWTMVTRSRTKRKS